MNRLSKQLVSMVSAGILSTSAVVVPAVAMGIARSETTTSNTNKKHGPKQNNPNKYGLTPVVLHHDSPENNNIGKQDESGNVIQKVADHSYSVYWKKSTDKSVPADSDFSSLYIATENNQNVEIHVAFPKNCQWSNAEKIEMIYDALEKDGGTNITDIH